MDDVAIGITLGIEYVPAETHLESGVKGHEVRGSGFFDELLYVRGQRVLSGGHGTYLVTTASHLILHVLVDGEEYEVWTERDFRSILRIQRLTQKVRKSIHEAMPREVELVRRMGQRGREYFRLSKESVVRWVESISTSAELVS